ncbi:thioredoxin fold domain-containing protein [Thiolapillus brandeum]|uniref:Thiol:disulfide interchange protein n=1 Tax=Thiolapillus brandeum TaxID=1076588 RepID=A0A7U6GJN7_9GAMM|nr:thioredoxin fold domain-containing protein [Thiolapillus brandeum]BAO44861.1 thiol:disulfide interchange protein DsbC [Thiolapillus brandeum]
MFYSPALRSMAICLALLVTGISSAAETAPADATIDKIRTALAKRLGDVNLDDIQASPVPGLYEVLIGARLYYVSADGRYFIQGKMNDLETGQDLTEIKVSAARKKLIDAVDEKDKIVFGTGKEKHTINVFTDVDCGYCRKLHSQIDQYNKEGIEVRYMAYPRAGVNSESGRKMAFVWCADDRKKAISEAKQGAVPEARTCDNPVAEQFALGRVVGVTGTPALVLENGELIPGYIPPARLRKLLDSKGLGKK